MIFTNDSKTSWKINGEEISINLEKIRCAEYYEKSNVVVFITENQSSNTDKLIVYNIEGEQIFNTNEPEGYQFEYLTSHPKAEIAVICGIIDIENSTESWSDFYFNVDLEDMKLKRLGVAR